MRRLEPSAEAGLQMHFALVLPMGLITGFFGMNFDGLPQIHTHTGVWIAAETMGVIGLELGVLFWQRRLLDGSRG